MKMFARVLVVLSLAAVSLSAKEYVVIETSDPSFNEVMNRFNDRMSVVIEDGASGSFSILGGCNTCSLDDSLNCSCTKRMCFRETPSEGFMCELLAQKKVMDEMRLQTSEHHVAWRISYEKNEVRSRIPYSMKVQWIRFKLTV